MESQHVQGDNGARAALQRHHALVAEGFSSLAGSPPELWKAYLLKFLDSYAYFSFSLIFTLFLSDEFGLSDVQAGAVYGAYGALITVFGLLTGTVIDNLGVAKCLRLGFVLSFLTRAALFACTSRGVLLACLLVALPLSNCLGIPVLTVGVRRYTNERNRGFAFGLFYVVMNVGALVAGPLVDFFTVYYNDKQDSVEAATAWTMTNNRAIILSGLIANFAAALVAFSVREIKVENVKQHESPRPMPKSKSVSSDDATRRTAQKISKFQPLEGSSYQIVSETLKCPNFRRYLVVCLLTINVRMVFRHLDATLPKYMIREFGEDTPKGRVYAINPALIIVLVPVITAATTAVDPLLMIHHGTYVSALSVFVLAIWTSVPACALFTLVLSVGEAIWSPRLYDYAMSVAQEGREGTYMALSSAPLFLAKLPVGFLSGFLLQKYCPEHLDEGEVRHSRTMWLIIGVSTVVSPIMITLLWGYISGGEDGIATRDDATRVSRGERPSHYTLREGHGEGSTGNITERDLRDGSSEHSYQHRPLISNISLPRVPPVEQAQLV